MSLLLLPALSPSAPRSSWWTAYRTTIENILKKLQPSHEHEIARLDIAIVPTSSFPAITNRSSFFPQFQGILRETYSLILASAAQVKVELDFPGGIDARIFFLETRPSETLQSSDQRYFAGPVVNLDIFVAAGRPYQTCFSVEDESGEAALQALLTAWRDKSPSLSLEISRLPCGLSVTSGHETAIDGQNQSHTSHQSVINGGTFDHLHIGHKLLLAATAYLAEPGTSTSSSTKRKITIGITGDELLVNKKHGALVESWDERQQRTAEFMDSILVFHPHISSMRTVQDIDQPGPNGKVVKVTYGKEVEINYTRISDPYGPTITDEAITAIIVSAETRAGGKATNDKRSEKGWKELEIFEVDVLDADVPEEYKGVAPEGQTFESKVSSTEIRRRLEAKARSSNGHL